MAWDLSARCRLANLPVQDHASLWVGQTSHRPSEAHLCPIVQAHSADDQSIHHTGHLRRPIRRILRREALQASNPTTIGWGKQRRVWSYLQTNRQDSSVPQRLSSDHLQNWMWYQSSEEQEAKADWWNQIDPPWLLCNMLLGHKLGQSIAEQQHLKNAGLDRSDSKGVIAWVLNDKASHSVKPTKRAVRGSDTPAPVDWIDNSTEGTRCHS